MRVTGSQMRLAWVVCALCVGASWLSAPPAAAAPTVASEIMTGQASSCAAVDGGAVKCWGWNYYGQLGVGTDDGPQNCNTLATPIACSTVPVSVSGVGSGVTAMGSGYAHTCALKTAGNVWCWGYAVVGQLGNGDDTGPNGCGQFPVACSTRPVAVTGLSGAASTLGVGWNHACVATSGGGVECWGGHGGGALGNGMTTGWSTTPVAIELQGDETATAIGGGQQLTCAVTGAGGVQC